MWTDQNFSIHHTYSLPKLHTYLSPNATSPTTSVITSHDPIRRRLQRKRLARALLAVASPSNLGDGCRTRQLRLRLHRRHSHGGTDATVGEVVALHRIVHSPVRFAKHAPRGTVLAVLRRDCARSPPSPRRATIWRRNDDSRDTSSRARLTPARERSQARRRSDGRRSRGGGAESNVGGGGGGGEVLLHHSSGSPCTRAPAAAAHATDSPDAPVVRDCRLESRAWWSPWRASTRRRERTDARESRRVRSRAPPRRAHSCQRSRRDGPRTGTGSCARGVVAPPLLPQLSCDCDGPRSHLRGRRPGTRAPYGTRSECHR